MKLYKIIKTILEDNDIARNSDKELIWLYAEKMCFIVNGHIDKEKFLLMPAFESITRARRKVQQIHAHLKASPIVEAVRREKQGEQIFEPVQIFPESFYEKD